MSGVKRLFSKMRNSLYCRDGKVSCECMVKDLAKIQAHTNEILGVLEKIYCLSKIAPHGEDYPEDTRLKVINVLSSNLLEKAVD